jgi:predicted O-methyltransferase YrrM
MDLAKAEQITGWMQTSELEWLATRASQCKRIAEIGSWMGRSARAMADNSKAEIWCVDTWRGSGEEHDRELAGKPKDWLFDQFKANMGDLLSAGRLMTLRADSIQAAQTIGLGFELRFDMIFIDGDHSYEGCKADLLAWKPLLNKGGLLCGHDFDGGRPGVVRAVKELIPNFIKASAGSIWMYIDR